MLRRGEVLLHAAGLPVASTSAPSAPAASPGAVPASASASSPPAGGLRERLLAKAQRPQPGDRPE
jgi:hypothetical protein